MDNRTQSYKPCKFIVKEMDKKGNTSSDKISEKKSP